MTIMTPTPLLLLLFLLGICHVSAITAGSTWKKLKKNIGIPAMHMQLMNTDHVVMYDRTDMGHIYKSCTSIHAENRDHKCRHSVAYDVPLNRVHPLMLKTDVWCSSGSLTPDGRLIQTGGFEDGGHVVRIYQSCRRCDWVEIPGGLVNKRWYATNHILPDGRQIIIGGHSQLSYEFYPKKPGADKAYNLRFLKETTDPEIENNLYPYVFLVPDGNLFIFANNRAILFDYVKGAVVRSYPSLPDGNPRNYPSTGSAVLLPLKNIQSSRIEVEVMVCGGAPKGSFAKAIKGTFVKALDSCGRIKITDLSPRWVTETMPLPRVMGDMILLPNGNILIINGAGNGTAGWEFGRDPVMKPVIYKPGNKIGSRFEIQNPSTIPRMYHSSAILVRDGRVLVGGSNAHDGYKFSGVLYPTELSLESFSPAYLDNGFANLRPEIIEPASQTKITYGQVVRVQFKTTGVVNLNLVMITMVPPSFNTHSFSMNQRLLVLGIGNGTIISNSTYQVSVNMPGTRNLAPPGYYMLFVVHQDIPSKGIWVNIQ